MLQRSTATLMSSLTCCCARVALQHQSSFDVKWCRGSVAELLFAPLIERMKGDGCQILGGQLVQEIKQNNIGDVTSVVARYAT